MTATKPEQSQTLTELARRLVACPHFHWLPGMSTTHNCVVVATLEGVRRVDGDNIFGTRRCPTAALDELGPSDLPDLSDPATRGCVLQLVRDAWTEHWAQVPGHAAPIVTTERVDEGWRWRLSSLRTGVDGIPDSVGTSRLGRCVGSEAEALVDALLAAPAR